MRTPLPQLLCLAMLAALLAAACSGDPVPSGPNGSAVEATPVVACGLVSPDELTHIFGQQLHPTDTGNRSCTWTASGGLPSVNLRFQPSDLAKARGRLGEPQNITVLGNLAVIGSEFGLSLYVQHGSEDLVIQSVLLNDSQANRSKLIAVAQAALGRLPSTAG